MEEKIVKVGDKLKIAGIGSLVVASFVAGDVVGTPDVEYIIQDSANTPKNQLMIEKRTPVYQKIVFSIETANEQIVKVQRLKEYYEGVLQTFISQLNEAKTEEEVNDLNRRINIEEGRITNYNNTIAYYQRLIDEVQPELNKLPER